MRDSSQVKLAPSERLRRLFARVGQERVPLSGSFDITHRCNYRCPHCYAGHLNSRPAAAAPELSTKQVAALLSEAAEAGCLLLLLSGGEPLVRRDFCDIYMAAKSLGLIITVFTNGSLLTSAHLETFASYPPHLVEVSVYGATEDTYEAISGVPGSYGLVRKNIERLLEHRVPVGMKTMILRDNLHEVAAIEDLARTLGVPFRSDPLVTPRLDGDLGPLAQRVDPRQAVKFEMSNLERRAEMVRFLRTRDEFADESISPANRLYRCGAGKGTFYVDPQGFLHPCLMSPRIAFDALSIGFAAAWKAVKTAVDEAVWEEAGGCAECATIELCGYCPGLFELENATPSRPPKYVCRLGEYRRRAIELDGSEVLHAGAS